jgi:DNA-binding MarR family transcriptional regulator
LLAVRWFHRKLEQALDAAVRGLGLSFAQYEVMELLDDEPKVDAGELARILGGSRQAAHHLVHQLERASLIELLPPDGSERGARLTDQGEYRLHRARNTLEATRRRIAALPQEQSNVMLAAHRNVERALGEPVRRWWFDD